jgi:hypothetical protein
MGYMKAWGLTSIENSAMAAASRTLKKLEMLKHFPRDLGFLTRDGLGARALIR